MRPLTDLEILALLSAAPIDHRATRTAGGDVDTISPGHVAPWEYLSATQLVADPAGPCADAQAAARRALARVFGLPPRDGSQPLVMAIAWNVLEVLDADLAARIVSALDACGAPAGTTVERIEALCAEVLELRRNAAAILRADVGPESERTIVEHVPFLDPEEVAQAEADRAAYSCSVDKPTIDRCEVCQERPAAETLNGEQVCEDCNPSHGPLRWCPWGNDIKGADCAACCKKACATCGQEDALMCEHDCEERHKRAFARR